MTKLYTSTTDLKVVVNDKYFFFLNKDLLLQHCGRIVKLYKKVLSETHGKRFFQIQLVNFPGGAEAFESAVRFCYCKDHAALTPLNVSKLRCAGEYLEMTEIYSNENLISRTEMYLKDVMFWDWEDLLTALKACQEVLLVAEKTRVVERCTDAVTFKIISTLSDYNSFSSSPDSAPFASSKTNASKRSSRYVSKTWWFSGLSSLPITIMERVVKALHMKNVDNKTLARFLFRYLRFSLPIHTYNCVSVSRSNDKALKISHDYDPNKQREVLEKIVCLLARLEARSISCKSLFSLLRMSVVLNASKLCKKHLEMMVGVQLNMATLDNILIPSQPPRSCSSLYDVDLVLRLVQHFLKEQMLLQTSVSENQISDTSPVIVSSGLIKVSELMDKYMAEVAPDANLKPQKFQALTHCLPDWARINQDGLYIAVDIYLQAHPSITESEAFDICKVLDYQKLSLEGCNHLEKNTRLPTRFALQLLLSHQSQLRNALVDSSKTERDSTQIRTLLRGTSNAQPLRHSEPLVKYSEPYLRNSEAVVQISEPIVSHSQSLAKFGYVIRQNQELKIYLKKMQFRVAKLEGMCTSMKSEVAKHFRHKRLVC